MESRVVVLGANGFLGRNLIRNLAGNVLELRAFGRSEMPSDFPINEGTWIKGDYRVANDLRNAIAGSDRVIHLISTSTPGTSDKNRAIDVEDNLIATIRLLDLCVEENVEQVIFMSSGGAVYGNLAEIPTPETSALNPRSSYGVVKIAIEKYLQIYKELYDLDYRIVRASNPYGPHQTGKNLQGLIGSILHSGLSSKEVELWGDGSVVRDFIYIDDLVDGLMSVLSFEGDSRIFNIGSGEGTTVLEIVELCRGVLSDRGHELVVNFKDSRLIDIKSSILDISLAKKELFWHPRTTLNSGIEKTLNWMSLGSGL